MKFQDKRQNRPDLACLVTRKSTLLNTGYFRKRTLGFSTKIRQNAGV